MNVSTRHPTELRPPRQRIGRRARRSQGVGQEAPARPPAAEAQPELARERGAGGPQDRASYHCQCGYVFEASVSTTVGCPHCGDAQAW